MNSDNGKRYSDYYQNKLESGLRYQDFVIDCCWNILGLAVVQYSSELYQKHVGESKTGAEIKHDEKYAKTGNLWIEVAEKAKPRSGPYAASGIRRSDNTWLYIIGDYDTVFIFSKRLLVGLSESGRYDLLENNTKTSVGFLLPHSDAQKYSAQILYPNASHKVGKEIKAVEAIGRDLHRLLVDPPGNQMDLFKH